MSSIDIIFSNPSKKYLPGDKVSGKVIFTTIESIPARFLKISWSGEAKCDWSGNESDSRQVYLSSYFIAWIAENGKDELPAGTHKYRFSFRLPTDCPPSFNGIFGDIRYSVSVELDRPWRCNVETSNTFHVIQKTNLVETAPEMLKSAKFFMHKNAGTIFKDGLFSIKVNFPTRAYLPGETIKALVTMENHSTKPINNLEFKLIQQSHYHTRPQKTPCSVADTTCPLGSKYRKDGETVIRRGTHQCHVAPGETRQVIVEVYLPNKLQATFESSMISMGYLLGFTIKNGSLTGNKLVCNARIVVGNEKRIDDVKAMVPMVPKKSAPPPPYTP